MAGGYDFSGLTNPKRVIEKRRREAGDPDARSLEEVEAEAPKQGAFFRAHPRTPEEEAKRRQALVEALRRHQAR